MTTTRRIALYLLQVVLRLTPLCEGEIDVLGIIFHLCVDQPLPSSPSSPSSPSLGGRGSESPGPPGRTSLPSLSVSGRDGLFQRQQNLRVQQSLAEGVQVCYLSSVWTDFHFCLMPNIQYVRCVLSCYTIYTTLGLLTKTLCVHTVYIRLHLN